MSDSPEQSVIQRTPVNARDESASALFGFQLSEWLVLLGVFIGTLILIGDQVVVIGSTAVVLFWLKRVEPMLPDNWASKMANYYFRTHTLYRAGGRDTEWRPPVADQ